MYSAKPTATPDEITAALKSSARAFPGVCNQCGTGLLDANAAVTAIKGGGGGGGTVAEVEPNNSRTAPQTISAPATVTGSLSTSDTNDYFKITLPAGKTLSATLTPASGKDFDLYLQNSSGTQLRASENGAGAVDSFTYTNSGSSSITVYVRVLYYSGTSGTYSLGLSW